LKARAVNPGVLFEGSPLSRQLHITAVVNGKLPQLPRIVIAIVQQVYLPRTAFGADLAALATAGSIYGNQK
jgi:hypothetical protein